MKELVPLIQEWTLLKSKIGNDKLSKDLFDEFELRGLDLIKDGAIEDYNISKTIFNLKPATNKFQNFKKGFKKKIYSAILEIDENIFVEKHRILIESGKTNTIAHILIALGLRKNAVIILKRGYRRSSKRFIHLESINFLRAMIPLIATTYGDDIEVYYNLLQHHLEEVRIEEEIKYLYFKYSRKIIKTGKFNDALVNEMFLDLVKVDLNKSKNPHFHYWNYMLKVLYSQVKFSFKETYNEAQEAINYFTENPIFAESRISYFRMVECYAQLKMGEYHDLSNKMLHYQKEAKERYRYLRYYEYLIQLYFRSREYGDLQMTFEKLRRESKQPEIDRTFKFRMNLYEYYFYLLHLGGKVESKEKDSIIDKRFRKYAERIKGDKSGFNVPVLIGELLRFCLTDRLDIVVDRIDAMRQYTYKHLNDPDNIRSKTFINMLSKLPGRHTNLKKFEKDIEKGLQVLKDNPLNKSRQADEMEIIPYEDLWDMVKERVLGVAVT